MTCDAALAGIAVCLESELRISVLYIAVTMLKKNLEMRPPACRQTSRLTSTLYLARRTYAGGIEDTAS